MDRTLELQQGEAAFPRREAQCRGRGLERRVSRSEEGATGEGQSPGWGRRASASVELAVPAQVRGPEQAR